MTTGKTIALNRRTFVDKVMSLLFNMLSTLVITFLPRSKHLLISWLQSPSAVILEPRKIKSDTVSTVSPSIYCLPFPQISNLCLSLECCPSPTELSLRLNFSYSSQSFPQDFLPAPCFTTLNPVCDICCCCGLVMYNWCNPMYCSLPDFSDHGIFQARISEWVAMPFTRGSS